MKAIYLLLFFALILTSPARAQETALRTVWVNVFDKEGKPVRNLPQSAFTINEEKIPQTIASFGFSEKPASVGFLFDISGSMNRGGGSILKVAGLGALDFVKNSNPSNDYFVMSFNEEIRLLTDWTNNPTELARSFEQLIDKESIKGRTRLYDACLEALNKLSTSKNSKRVIVLVTDSYDNQSEQSRRKIIKLVRRENVLIYAIVAREPYFNQGSRFVETVSKLTGGGTAFVEYSIEHGEPGFMPMTTKQISQRRENAARGVLGAFDFFTKALRNQYEISYISSNNTSKRELREIEIKLNASPEVKKQFGKLFVYHRTEYLNEN